MNKATMDQRSALKGFFISWFISASLIPVTLVTADMGLFGVRLCKAHRQVLACPFGHVIQFVDVIFSVTTGGPQTEGCDGKAQCRKQTSNSNIMHDMYDICIQQPACDVDFRQDWVTCPGAQLFTANYTEIVYTCVIPDDFSMTLPGNRTNGRRINYDMSAEDAALRPTTTTETPPETPPPTADPNPVVTSIPTETEKPPIWKPVTNPPSILINTESTIILAAVLAFVVFAFCGVACGFAYALKVGRIDKKKLPRCLIRTASELPPDHVYADIDYANMYPRGRAGSGIAPTMSAATESTNLDGIDVDDPANAGSIHSQQIIPFPYLEFIDARGNGHITPLPRTDPYYFVYDPAHGSAGHRIVIPGGSNPPPINPNDPLLRSSSVVLQRHQFPHAVTPRQHHTQRRHHHHPHRLPRSHAEAQQQQHQHHVPVARLCGQQELPDLVHHENHYQSNGNVNACHSQLSTDTTGTILEDDFERDEDSKDSHLFSATSLPDVSANMKGPRQSRTSSGSSLGAGSPGDLNPQVIVSRQVTIDSAFEDDYENNTDESHSSNNHLTIVDRNAEKRFMMDSHEYLTPVSSASAGKRENAGDRKNNSAGQSVRLPPPRPNADIHKASTRRIRGNRPTVIAAAQPTSTVNNEAGQSLTLSSRGKPPSRAHSRPNKKGGRDAPSSTPAHRRAVEARSVPTHRRVIDSDTAAQRRAVNNDAALPLDVQLLENPAPDYPPPALPSSAEPLARARSDDNLSDPSSNGLNFSPSVRV